MSERGGAVGLWLLVLVLIGEIVLLMFSKFDLATVGLLHVGAFSVLTALAFLWDKWRAGRGARRVSEVTLLTMSVVGGAFGGLMAMLAARHKTQRRLFWLVVGGALFVHVTIVGWFFVSR